MSNHQFYRKPKLASETFITTVVVLIFISIGVFLFYSGRNTHVERSKESIDQKQTKQTNPHEQEVTNESFVGFPLNLNDVEGNVKTFDPCETEMNVPPTGKLNATYAVHPPLPALTIAAKVNTVNANVGEIIMSEHHSQIQIPANAFVDKDGRIVKGDVEVKCREFHNYLDIFLSGIPMKYDSGGAEQLESAGMIELTASQNNQPVFVNQNSKINIMLASLNKSPDYNLYYFNQAQGKWIYKGKDKIMVSSDNSFATRQYDSVLDSTEQKFIFKPKDYKVRLYSIMEPAPKKKYFFSKKQEPNKFTFHFVASRLTIPELNLINSITWKYTGRDATDVYQELINPLLGRTYSELIPRSWKNMSIVPNKEDGTYLLTMLDDENTISVKLLPQIRSEAARKKFEKKFSEFFVMQQARLQDEKVAFENFRKDTTAYFANNPRWVKSSMPVSFAVLRQFEIDGFGIWNCDQPIRMQQASVVNVSFVDNNNLPLLPERMFLVEKQTNTVYSYNNADLKKFKFNPKAQNLLCIIFPGNKISVIQPAEFNEKIAKSRGKCKIKIEGLNDTAMNREELKKQMRFDL